MIEKLAASIGILRRYAKLTLRSLRYTWAGPRTLAQAERDLVRTVNDAVRAEAQALDFDEFMPQYDCQPDDDIGFADTIDPEHAFDEAIVDIEGDWDRPASRTRKP